MTTHFQNLERFYNPVRVADELVLALSEGGQVPPKLFLDGIKLCEYLTNLLEEVKTSTSPKKEQWPFHALRDKNAFEEFEIDPDKMLEKIKDVNLLLNNYKENPALLKPEQINKIQEYLVTVTVPIWSKQNLEFRKKVETWVHY